MSFFNKKKVNIVICDILGISYGLIIKKICDLLMVIFMLFYSIM